MVGAEHLPLIGQQRGAQLQCSPGIPGPPGPQGDLGAGSQGAGVVGAEFAE